ncbi:YjcZ family sporulation protein [Radiobacillus kanasensis]|uniref:YjcZ family sporulation protein n=1 Tax=Radiobacillus kanasensis TaxID=2844358 RepID=UPI001E5EECD6|nr:YjcZ family sporulation protein [Radiobacillus kanasensis]UFT99029.1 YjcZ family sporulation protein [Radiobacillus kanasensis]
MAWNAGYGAYNYVGNCQGGGFFGGNNAFTLLVVLFVLLVIIGGASYPMGEIED